jgi:hypothetical protein
MLCSCCFKSAIRELRVLGQRHAGSWQHTYAQRSVHGSPLASRFQCKLSNRWMPEKLVPAHTSQGHQDEGRPPPLSSPGLGRVFEWVAPLPAPAYRLVMAPTNPHLPRQLVPATPPATPQAGGKRQGDKLERGRTFAGCGGCGSGLHVHIAGPQEIRCPPGAPLPWRAAAHALLRPQRSTRSACVRCSCCCSLVPADRAGMGSRPQNCQPPGHTHARRSACQATQARPALAPLPAQQHSTRV